MYACMYVEGGGVNWITPSFIVSLKTNSEDSLLKVTDVLVLTKLNVMPHIVSY